MADQTPEIALTEDEHKRWMVLAEQDGWEDVSADALFGRAVEGLAWGLIETTMDTADRAPSAETYSEAISTATDLILALRASPGSTEEVDRG